MDHGHLHIDRTTGVVDPASRDAFPPENPCEGDMAISVYIPTPFRKLTGNRQNVEAEGKDVAEVLANVDKQFPGFQHLVFGSGDGGAGAHQHLREQAGDLVAGRHQDGGEGRRRGRGDPGDGRRLGRASRARKRIGALTGEQVDRYSRHIIMPQVGPSGQRKIMESSVLIIGAGGLGSPIAVYLALAGIGKIGIVDFDTVDISNLQRQILHQNDDIGKLKAISAKETINAYNPDVEVVVHERADHVRQLDGDHRAVRLHHQRRRQLRGALPGERHLPLPEEAADRRLDPAVRRPGDGVPAGPGLLSLPLSRAAAARHGAELRRGGRARARSAAPSARSRRRKC